MNAAGTLTCPKDDDEQPVQKHERQCRSRRRTGMLIRPLKQQEIVRKPERNPGQARSRKMSTTGKEQHVTARHSL